MKDGSFSSSCSWGFHLMIKRTQGWEPTWMSGALQLETCLKTIPHLLGSERSMLVPNLMIFPNDFSSGLEEGAMWESTYVE